MDSPPCLFESEKKKKNHFVVFSKGEEEEEEESSAAAAEAEDPWRSLSSLPFHFLPVLPSCIDPSRSHLPASTFSSSLSICRNASPQDCDNENAKRNFVSGNFSRIVFVDKSAAFIEGCRLCTLFSDQYFTNDEGDGMFTAEWTS